MSRPTSRWSTKQYCIKVYMKRYWVDKYCYYRSIIVEHYPGFISVEFTWSHIKLLNCWALCYWTSKHGTYIVQLLNQEHPCRIKATIHQTTYRQDWAVPVQNEMESLSLFKPNPAIRERKFRIQNNKQPSSHWRVKGIRGWHDKNNPKGQIQEY